VTILDANILLYAYDAEAPHHTRLRRYLEELFSKGESIGIPWISAWAFIRISTNPRLTVTPFSTAKAFQIVGELLAESNVNIVEPGPRHFGILEKLCAKHRVIGPPLTDAVLAALALEHGASLASTDRGFARFTEVKWIDPMAE
jgi:toxin-antitoxin system PIN domain toxin